MCLRNEEKIFDKLIYMITTFLLFWATGIVIITSVFLLLGISVNMFNVIIPFIICCVVYNGRYKKYASAVVGISVVIMVGCILFASASYDHTWDGEGYHKPAVGLLNDGWNPTKYSADSYLQFSESIPKEMLWATEGSAHWAECYPKASWYFAASLYSITNNIESGKAYTVLFIIILFGLSYCHLNKKLGNKPKSILGALVIAVNPIALCQIQCYYVDGLAACILLALMIELIAVANETDIRISNRFTILSLIVWGCNLKFSILGFTGLICIAHFCFCAYMNRKRFRNIKNLFVIYFSAALFSVVVVGYAPYVTNMIRYKNLFAGFADLIGMDMNEIFGIANINRFQRVLISLFGKMSHGEYNTIRDALKIPFTVHAGELGYYSIPDTRLSAYGVWFSGILILSVVVIIFYIIKHRSSISSRFAFALLLCAITIVELFAFEQSFAMRYIPHLYMIVIMAYVIILQKPFPRQKLAIVFMTIAVLFNICPWIWMINVKNEDGILIREQLKCLSKEIDDKDYNLQIAFSSTAFWGIHYTLKDNGITDYEFTKLEDIDDEKTLIYGNWLAYSLHSGYSDK